MTRNPDHLDKSAARLVDWIGRTALPLWAERAHLPDGSWVEHLYPDGQPDLRADRRWRVLARQVYVYAKATKRGWFEGREIAERTYAKMCEIGYVHRVGMDGRVKDDLRDLYDHAFYLLATASLLELTEDPKYLRAADDLLHWITTEMAHPSGGWRENNKATPTDPRRQNPHMHMLEASLALHRVSGETEHLQFARTVYDLFETHLFDCGTISEFFSANWTLSAGPDGQSFEPGHAVEWIWLLGQYAKATGADVLACQKMLYARAIYGRDIFLNDEEDKSGEIRRETKRLWVQTEVIKAHLSMAEAGTAGSRDMAAATIDALFPIYLTPDGLWNDQINACHANVAPTIPVSTFYHIVCMAGEAERVAQA